MFGYRNDAYNSLQEPDLVPWYGLVQISALEMGKIVASWQDKDSEKFVYLL